MLILLFYGILHCCILHCTSSSNDLFVRQPTLTCSVGCRDHLGDCTVVGDKRWAGSYGFDVDCVALDHSSALFVNINQIKVGFPNSQPHLDVHCRVAIFRSICDTNECQCSYM